VIRSSGTATERVHRDRVPADPRVPDANGSPGAIRELEQDDPRRASTPVGQGDLALRIYDLANFMDGHPDDVGMTRVADVKADCRCVDHHLARTAHAIVRGRADRQRVDGRVRPWGSAGNHRQPKGDSQDDCQKLREGHAKSVRDPDGGWMRLNVTGYAR
jgi:hypothetical protein